MNKIEQILIEQNFSLEESETFLDIIKYAKTSVDSGLSTNDLKKYINTKVEELLNNEN